MSSKPEITIRLANRLKEARTAKGLSLDALAKLSGVSRSMLSQIERGGSSPTVASLWNLTRALNVDFAGLLDEDQDEHHPIKEYISADETPVISQKESGCTIRILSAPSDVGETEVYDITFNANALMDSAPHKRGCLESITVLEGALKVTSHGHSVQLAKGDTARYEADKNHAIQAESPARALLIVKNA
ncbi:DNA-binding protein [Amylibacter ulvae]|uniref:DNA-binding protein n=1 Tax=Paramylibacter ulvae TaxID=1651968 RepID=A0ABQ3CZH9_9RHOB|nr:XRE family transcriptional regulator [Amylibacter ulvae]GHA48712.1 DNA-binding protein [Amylibacter ulvae]